MMPDTLCLMAIIFWASSLSAYFTGDKGPNYYQWNSNESGSWIDESKWSGPFGFPNTSIDNAHIQTPGEYLITVPIDIELDSLTVQNSNTTLYLLAGVEQKIFRAFDHQGQIVLNPFGGSSARLRLGPDLSVSGNGTIRLNATTTNGQARLGTIGGIVTLGDGISVLGSGEIWGNYVNQGLICSANSEGLGIVINKTISQTATGIVRMNGNQLTILDGASVQGGTLELINGGSVRIEDSGTTDVENLVFGPGSSATFAGTTLYPFGELVPDRVEVMGNSSKLIIENSILNNGSIAMLSLSGPGRSELVASNNLTIDGNGEIHLDGNQSIMTIQSGVTLTVGANQLIRGSGGIITISDNSLVVNHGIVRADILNTGISIQGNHTGGLYEAEAGNILLSGAKIDEGHFRSIGEGRLKSGNSFLLNPTLLNDLELFGDLHLEGSVTNNGRIRLDVSNSFNNLKLEVTQGSEIFGTGAIELIQSDFENDAPIISGNFTMHSPHEIRGAGFISGLIENNSVIRATDSNSNHPLILRGRYTGGLYTAENNATMMLGGEHHGGTYATSDGRFVFFDVELFGAKFITTGIGHVRLLPDRDLRMESMRLDANLDLCIGSTVIIDKDVELNGDHLVLDQGTFGLQGGLVSGTGSITLRKSSSGTPRVVSIQGSSGFGDDYLISGSGIIGSQEDSDDDAVFVTGKLLLADDPIEALTLVGNIRSNGVLEARNAELVLGDQLVLEGGTLKATANGSVKIAQGVVTIQDVTNESALRVNDGRSILNLRGNLYNDSVLTVGFDIDYGGGTVVSDGDTSILGNGIIEMTESQNSQRPVLLGRPGRLTIGPGQVVKGSGALLGSILNQGTLLPGGSSRVLYTGRVILGNESRVILNINGTKFGEYDRFISTFAGGVELGGRLEICFGEYVPKFGDVWRLIDDGDHSGMFDEFVTDQALAPDEVYLFKFSDDGLELVVTCRGDLNGDLAIDFIDVVMLITATQEEAPEADINDDGVIDYFDISYFLQLLANPC